MMQKKRSWLPLLALTALALSLPCFAEAREEFHKTVPMDANGVFTLKNVNGDVAIEGWDRNEAQIDAVKTGVSKEKLRDARILVMGSGHNIDVETKYPEHSNNNATVRYTVKLPRNATLREVAAVNGNVAVNGARGRIEAKTVNGNVEVWGAVSEIELETVNGGIKASLTGPQVKRAKLDTVNGSVAVQIPLNANARIKASTVNGSIQSDLPVQVDKPKYGPGASVNSNLGSGGETVELESVNGSVYLHKS
ncbi:MAG: hypothetical protein P4M01_02940 [Acidobacteriota bacterium]|nr:hypothetical protein [Acidobacteriota bacterium]